MLYSALKSRLKTLCAAAIFLSTAAFVEGRNLDIYVLTGQSNSLGTTDNPAEYGAAPDASAIDSEVPFWWSNLGAWELGDSDGQVKSLQVQQSKDNWSNNPSFWGPEFGFARAFYEAGQRDFMVIKVSRGGGGNTNWSKAAGGDMYTRIVAQVNAAAGAITAGGDTFSINGLLYLQGESDDASEAAIAAQRFSALFSDLQSDLPNASGMHAVIAGITAEGATRDVVRQQHAAVGAASASIDYFDTTDLRPSLYDNLHLDKSAKMIVGERFAQQFLAVVPEPTSMGVVGLAGAMLLGRRRKHNAECTMRNAE